MAQRVLVVDDLDEMRVLIRRALSANGYEVDVAATLAEAQGMDLAGYDAVLVDAHLGSGRGIDLIETLRSQDPAAAGRCMVITGGAADVPEGVPVLAKPFRVSDLLTAVRALQQSVAVTKPGETAEVSVDPVIQLSASGPQAKFQPRSATPRCGNCLAPCAGFAARAPRAHRLPARGPDPGTHGGQPGTADDAARTVTQPSSARRFLTAAGGRGVRGNALAGRRALAVPAV